MNLRMQTHWKVNVLHMLTGALQNWICTVSFILLCTSYPLFFAFILLTFFPLLNEGTEILPLGFNVCIYFFLTWGERGSELVRVTSCLAGLSQTVHQGILGHHLLYTRLSPRNSFLQLRRALKDFFRSGFALFSLCLSSVPPTTSMQQLEQLCRTSTEHNRLCSRLFPPRENSSASLSAWISTHLLI